MKRIVIGMSLSVASLLAHADGQQYQYEQAAVNAAAHDPNEALVNDDGAQENPNARMSGTARAYRNGYYNGKKAQRDQHEQADNPPPLPPGYPGQAAPPPRVVAQDDQSHYTTIPPQPRVWAQAGDTYAGVQSAPPPAPGAYVQRDERYGYDRRPVQPPVNVYVQAPQPQYYEPPQPVYEEPQPVYTQAPPEYYEPPPGPPASTYVVIRGIPPTLATGYWPRGYYPHYAVQPRVYPRYYRPY